MLRLPAHYVSQTPPSATPPPSTSARHHRRHLSRRRRRPTQPPAALRRPDPGPSTKTTSTSPPPKPTRIRSHPKAIHPRPPPTSWPPSCGATTGNCPRTPRSPTRTTDTAVGQGRRDVHRRHCTPWRPSAGTETMRAIDAAADALPLGLRNAGPGPYCAATFALLAVDGHDPATPLAHAPAPRRSPTPTTRRRGLVCLGSGGSGPGHGGAMARPHPLTPSPPATGQYLSRLRRPRRRAGRPGPRRRRHLTAATVRPLPGSDGTIGLISAEVAAVFRASHNVDPPTPAHHRAEPIRHQIGDDAKAILKRSTRPSGPPTWRRGGAPSPKALDRRITATLLAATGQPPRRRRPRRGATSNAAGRGDGTRRPLPTSCPPRPCGGGWPAALPPPWTPRTLAAPRLDTGLHHPRPLNRRNVTADRPGCHWSPQSPPATGGLPDLRSGGRAHARPRRRRRCPSRPDLPGCSPTASNCSAQGASPAFRDVPPSRRQESGR